MSAAVCSIQELGKQVDVFCSPNHGALSFLFFNGEASSHWSQRLNIFGKDDEVGLQQPRRDDSDQKLSRRLQLSGQLRGERPAVIRVAKGKGRLARCQVPRVPGLR